MTDPARSDLNSLSPCARRSALALLVQQGDDAASAVLSGALSGSHWPVCDELADALAAISTGAARDALTGALRARRHHVRSAAIKALVRLGDRDVREAIERLIQDPSYEVRQDVKEALRQLGGDER